MILDPSLLLRLTPAKRGKTTTFSSYQVNKQKLLDRHFRWQTKYGAFSFDLKRLHHYVAYVENQKRHHAEKTTIRILERTESPPSDEVRELVIPYGLDEEEWRRELEDID